MEDILANLSDTQKAILKDFRENLKEIITPDHTDYYLVKFLRANNFNLREAVKIFNQSYYNRMTYGINTIVDTFRKPEVLRKYDPVSVLGFARNGSLIQYIQACNTDLLGFIMSMSCSELCIYTCYVLESELKMLREHNLKTGRNVQEITFVWDLAGFKIQDIFHKCVVEMGLDFARIMQETYPEVWSVILLVNAPKIFDKAYNLFKPVFGSAMSDKIKMADKASTKTLLLKYIDEDVLPAFLGGKKLDSKGNPECKEFVHHGGKIPERLYSRNVSIPLCPSDPDVKCLTIRPRALRNIIIPIKEAVTKMRFQISSEDGSIHFSMFYKEFGSDLNATEIPAEDENLDDSADDFKYRSISVQIRMQIHCAKEDMTVSLFWPGIYVIRLSNSGSWFTSRKCLVKYELFPPKNQTTL